MSKISLKHSGGNVVSLNSPTSAPTSADVAFNLPNADGSAGQFMKTDGSGNLSFDAVTAGITQSDEWRINTGFNATTQFLTSNWERNDTDFALIGSGMTESSGVFTFPATGVYRISYYIVAYASNKQVRYIGGNIHQTTNNSNYTKRSNGYTSLSNDANAYCSTSMTNIFDVTNTTTHKVKFDIEAESEVGWDGSSTQNRTYVTFTRLGDT